MRPVVTLTGGKRVPFIWTQTVKPSNDLRCKGCRKLHCLCPDPIWNGNVPPLGAA